MSYPSSRRRLASLAVCLFTLTGVAQASAATPGAVSVRVEGAAATLVPRVTVTTTTAPIDKGTGTACSGTSAGGALQQATAGNWSGPYTFAQIVETIKGESHPFSGGSYWALWVNGKASESGLCDTELQPGDQVLFYAACAGASNGCFSGEPLVATAPATAAPGAPFTVAVTESTTTFGGAPDYKSTTTKGPSAGATVAGGGLSAQTGADGKATLTATARGPLNLLVTKPGQVRVAVSVCVTDGADGFCGSAAPCQTNGNDGACGTTDRTAPLPAIRGGLKEQAVFSRTRAPYDLAGTVASDPSGLQDVRLRLTRRKGPHCSFLDGDVEHLVKSKVCGASGGTFFSIGDKREWSYLLPVRLPAGRYVLDVQAVDKAGNVSKISARGRDRIVFTVR